MRKFLYSACAILSLCLFAGCSDDDTPTSNELVGEWHLTEWSGAASGAFDAYIHFLDASRCEIYQKVDSPLWQRYNATYNFDGETLSGIYADGQPWGSSYSVTVSNKELTLTGGPEGNQEVSTYVREEIPASVKNSAVDALGTRSEQRRLL